jgi:hypothetical protein
MSYSIAYSDYHQLFGRESVQLRDLVIRKKAIAVAAQSSTVEAPTPANIKEKLMTALLKMTDFSTMGLDVGTSTGMALDKETGSQINHSFTALAALSSFLSIVSLKNAMTEEKKRNQLFAAQGLELPLTDAQIARKVLNEHKMDLLILFASNIATGLLIIPDVTTIFTKTPAAAIFILIGLYNATRTFYAAHQTTQKLRAVKAITFEAEDKTNKTYQQFVDALIKKNPKNHRLIEGLLDAGKELSAANLNLQTTQLTDAEWKALVERTLNFKRTCQIISGIRILFSSIAVVFMMIPSAIALASAKLAMYLASFAPQSRFAGLLSSAGLTVLGTLQAFTQWSLLKRFVFKKLAPETQQKLKMAEPVFSKAKIKGLFYRFNSKGAAEYALKIKELGLTDTLLLLQGMKDNDPLFSKHPELRGLLEELRQGLNEHGTKHQFGIGEQIQKIQAIADMIGSVPALTVENKRSLLEAISDLPLLERRPLSLALNQLTAKPLLAYSEDSKKLIAQLRKGTDGTTEGNVLIIQLLSALAAKNPPTPSPEPVFTEAEIKKFRQAANKRSDQEGPKFKEIIAFLETLTSDRLDSAREKYGENEIRDTLQTLKNDTNPDSIVCERLIHLSRIMTGTLSIDATSTAIRRMLDTQDPTNARGVYSTAMVTGTPPPGSALSADDHPQGD